MNFWKHKICDNILKWGCFIQRLNIDIDWCMDMEHEIDSNIRYLPDMYIKKYNMFIVCAKNKYEIDNWIEFALKNKAHIIFPLNKPSMTPLDCLLYDIEKNIVTKVYVLPFADLIHRGKYGIFYYCGGEENWNDIEPYKKALSHYRTK